MKVTLDWNDYPDIRGGDPIFRPPPESLRSVPYLYDRALSARYMLALSGGTDALKHTVSAEVHLGTFNRASLSDFVGMEEVMQNAGYKDFKILNSTSPLLHFMRLMRHYQIHLGDFSIGRHEVQVLFYGKPAEMTVGVIADLHPDQFLPLKAVSRFDTYSASDLQRMIDLFDEQQRRMGAYEVFYQGIQRLITDIEAALRRRPPTGA